MTLSLPTRIDIAATYQQLLDDHRRCLAPHGVPPLADLASPPGCALLELIYLRAHMGKAVHKDAVADFRRLHNSCCGNDAQVRHWKRRGWDVRGSGRSKEVMPDGTPVPPSHYCLASLGPSPVWLKETTRDQAIGNATDWVSLVAAHGGRCALCGVRTEHLQKGHLDPRQPLHIPDNCVPLCGDCNGWMGNMFVIDRRGRPKTVLPNPDSRALFKGLTKRDKAALIHLIETA
jgi:hypothetical protein